MNNILKESNMFDDDIPSPKYRGLMPFWQTTDNETVRLYHGHVLNVVAKLPGKAVHTIMTSPPYWGLRDYGTADWIGGSKECNHINYATTKSHLSSTLGPKRDGLGATNAPHLSKHAQYKSVCDMCGAKRVDDQLGNEKTPEEYISKVVSIFRELKRVLRDDGTVWLNLGDTYSSGDELENGNLVGIPWRVALALQADGWMLRQDIIWCLSGGAYVYAKTQKGEMPMMIKDLVRLDSATVKLWNGTKWTQVLGWGLNPDPREPIELVLRSGERIGCTGEHIWPTQRGNIRACELKVGDVIKTCTLPEPEQKGMEYLTEDGAWLIGLYLAEGSRADDTIVLSLNADEKRWIDKIQQIAKYYGGSSTHTISNNKLSIRVYSRILCAVLDEYIGGKIAADKYLKVPTWRLSNKLLKRIADGYLNGDGYYDADNNRYRLGFTRNYQLEQSLRTLAARLGAKIVLNTTMSSCQTGIFPSFKGEWRWQQDGHHNSKNVGQIKEIRSSRARQFWDISVADEPNLFSLASGVLTHNCKPNPMPESVQNRCTKAHEYVFLLTKQMDYYYDIESVKEGDNEYTRRATPNEKLLERSKAGSAFCASTSDKNGFGRNITTIGRNKRSVWNIPSNPYPGAHFATFPPKLIEPCILAGTSEYGCCVRCGDPYKRITAKNGGSILNAEHLKRDRSVGNRNGKGASTLDGKIGGKDTIGWMKTCICSDCDDVVPCTVLDPFMGAATTAITSLLHKRRVWGIELSKKYIVENQIPRIKQQLGKHPITNELIPRTS